MVGIIVQENEAIDKAIKRFKKKYERSGVLKEFKKRRDLIYKLISEIPDVRVNKPEGSFYIFPDFSNYLGRKDGKKVIKTTLDLADYLLQNANAGIVPGEAFGAKGYLRFSFATSSENIKKGIANIKNALSKLL